MILQLADHRSSLSFSPRGQALRLAKVQLERGETAASYVRESTPPAQPD